MGPSPGAAALSRGYTAAYVVTQNAVVPPSSSLLQELVNRARVEAGLTWRDAARLTGLSVTTLRALDGRRTSSGTLRSLGALGVSAADVEDAAARDRRPVPPQLDADAWRIALEVQQLTGLSRQVAVALIDTLVRETGLYHSG